MKNIVFKAPKSRFLFYLISFTWGLPMTLIGVIVAIVLLIKGRKPTKFGRMLAFEFNIDYGTSLGLIMICPYGDDYETFTLKSHEHGHSLQNLYFGPLFPFIVAIPSFIRYWYREWEWKHKQSLKSAYDDIWFEGTATKSGINFMNEFLRGEKK